MTTRIVSSLASGSGPTMYYDVDVTETSRTSTTVTYTVTAYAHLSSQTYDFFNAYVTPSIVINGSPKTAIGTMGQFPKGAGTKSCSISYTTSASAGSSSLGWTFSATQSLGGTSSSSTGYVAGVSGTIACSVYATTPSMSGSITVQDGGLTLGSYFRENFDSNNSFTVSWPAATNGNGTINYQLQASINGGGYAVVADNISGTSYTHTPGSNFSSIRYAVLAHNTIGSYTTNSGFIYSTTLNENVMQSPTISSSDSVSFTTPSFNVNIGAATDNMGSAMTYTIKGVNWTTFTASAGDPAYLKGKWLGARYNKTLANNTTVPQLSDISGLTPAATVLVADTTANFVDSAGWSGLDNFVSSWTTSVYVASPTAVSVTMNSDDTANFYLNGASIGTVPTYNAAATFTANLLAGWNTLQVLQYEQTGGESLTLNSGGATLSSKVTTMLAESNSNTAVAGSNTIYTNNGTSGSYFTLAQLKTAALAGTTASNTSSYAASLDIQVRATNIYGTSKTVTISVPVDLGKDAPISASVSTPTYSGTYTINGTAYYFPKYKNISVVTPSAVQDALGRYISFDLVYNDGSDHTISNSGIVTSGTYTFNVNDVNLNLGSTSKNITFKVTAKTWNGVTKSSSSTASIPVHYWNKPTISITNIARTTSGSTFSVSIKRNTSLSIATANTVSLSAVNPTTAWTMTGDAGNTTATETFTATSPTLAATDKPTVTITANDPVGVGLAQSAGTANAVIPVFVPAFTIRELGVGVNAIPDGTGQLVVSGVVRIKDGSGYFHMGNGALVMNDNSANGDTTGTNFDHMWHDDSSNTWYFASDDTYKNTTSAKSTLQAGKVRTYHNGGQSISLQDNSYVAGTTGMYNYIGFNDGTGTWQGYAGFGSARDNVFNITSNIGDIKLSPASGNKVSIVNGLLDMGGKNITNINHMQIQDPGVNEGLEWLGGNGWRIFESPNDMTNASGNFQITTGTTTASMKMTLDVNGSPTFYGNSLTVNNGGNLNHGVEIGSQSATVATYSFVDFHSSQYGANDYDGRIIYYGGSSGVNGDGGLTIYAHDISLMQTGYLNINAYTGHGSGQARLWYDATNNELDFWNQGNGQITLRAAGFASGSKREYKTNIEPHTDSALSSVINTPVYTYHLKEELNTYENEKANEMGMSKTIKSGEKDPSTVRKHTGLILDEAPEELIVGDGIDIYSMVSVLWKSVQELSGQVDELKAKLAKK